MNMKKLYIVICLFLLSIGGSAQEKESKTIMDRLIWDDKMLNIMIDTRVDFRADIQNGDLDNLTFYGQTLKLWLVGEIIPGIRYRIRQRLNKPQTPLREGYSAATDQAWIAFDVAKKWTFTVGKQSVQFGTFEYDYNPADIYVGTQAFNDLDAYKTGVNVAYKFLGQTLNLQIVNSDAPEFASDDYANKALAGLVMWEGHLFNGLLGTRWGYGAFQHSKTKFYNWGTFGVQLNLRHFTTEMDYYVGPYNIDYGAAVSDETLGTRYVRDQSASLNLKYNMGKWRPFIKGTWNQRYDQGFGSNAYENMGVQGVVEFYPFTNEYVKDLRFHAMYAYGSTDFQGAFANLSNQDVHTFLVGIRWLFKAK